MRYSAPIRTLNAKAETTATRRAVALKAALLGGAALLAGMLMTTPRAQAGAALCASAECPAQNSSIRDGYFRFSTALPDSTRASGLHHTELSDQDFSSFSGVGVIVCTIDGKSRSSTAFLVGAFDIAVTVAHTFETESTEQPHCVYNSTDSLGQIRERIPVAYIKSQWAIEAGASGELSKDLAVVRLTQPSRYAQRTMPLGRFSGSAAPVVMVGFQADIHGDTLKRKKRGRVYEQSADGIAISSLEGFTHDMDSMGIASGAPVIDERTGVIIGIHTRVAESKNKMITMNDWLEATLRTEMQAQEEPRPN